MNVQLSMFSYIMYKLVYNVLEWTALITFVDFVAGLICGITTQLTEKNK
jgi:hypothetical protein